MAVFSELEKEVILNEVREKYQCRTEKEFKQYVEIIAGLRIIKKVMGDR